MEKSCMRENLLDENILRSMEQEEIVYVLIDGSINLLWKINLTNVLVVIKKRIRQINNIM